MRVSARLQLFSAVGMAAQIPFLREIVKQKMAIARVPHMAEYGELQPTSESQIQPFTPPALHCDSLSRFLEGLWMNRARLLLLDSSFPAE
jgi:hypothetical protein